MDRGARRGKRHRRRVPHRRHRVRRPHGSRRPRPRRPGALAACGGPPRRAAPGCTPPRPRAHPSAPDGAPLPRRPSGQQLRAPLRAAAMKRTADVVVVGGGVIGCAIARELARRGVRTIVVERGEVGGEATRAAAGMVAPQAESTGPGPLLRLGIASRARYAEWTESLGAESGIDVEYRTDGIVYVALTAADARLLGARARWQRAAGSTPSPGPSIPGAAMSYRASMGVCSPAARSRMRATRSGSRPAPPPTSWRRRARWLPR